MPNFVIHGLRGNPDKATIVRGALIGAVTVRWPGLIKAMVVQDADDRVWTDEGEEAPYIEVRSTVSPGIPTLDELAQVIKSVCDHHGLDIELLEITDFIPKSEPPAE